MKALFTAFVFSFNIALCVAQQTKDYVVPFYKNTSGTLELNVAVNNVPARFIFDPGATLVSFDKTFFKKLVANHAISEESKKLKTQTLMSDGNYATAWFINLKSFSMGDLVMNNVNAMVIDADNAPLLIGQSVIQRLISYTIDNNKSQLRLTATEQKAYLNIGNLRFIPCATTLFNETDNILSAIQKTDLAKFDTVSVETHVPTNAEMLKKITSHLTIRYFDTNDQKTADFLKGELLIIGYAQDQIHIEDMTPYYSTPIPNYFEIWLK